MNSPSRPTRESTTRSSVWLQNGHFIGPSPVYRRASAGGTPAPRRPAARTAWSRVGSFWVERELTRQLLDLAAHRRLDRGRSEVSQHPVDEARDLDHLRFAHPPRGDR